MQPLISPWENGDMELRGKYSRIPILNEYLYAPKWQRYVASIKKQISSRGSVPDSAWKDELHLTVSKNIKRILKEQCWDELFDFHPDDPFRIVGCFEIGDLCEIEGLMAIEEEYSIDSIEKHLTEDMSFSDFVAIIVKLTSNGQIIRKPKSSLRDIHRRIFRREPKTFPARVHIILARNSDRAIAIRRGPSRKVCTIGWDRKTDTFSVGQWLKGRIYERRCDLSPDGEHLIYFAMNGRWFSKTRGSWTAISRTPYLKAIGLWANGNGWNGGGLFLSNDSYWINSGFFAHEEQLKPANPLRESKKYPFHERYGGECPGVYYVRLQRDGWVLKKQANNAESDSFTIFEKPLGKGWSLEKTAHATINELPGKGCYYDTHRLVNRDQEIALDYPDWEWADLDHHRIVWVEHGVLYSADIIEEGLGSVKSLYDFNALKFEAIKAPY